MCTDRETTDTVAACLLGSTDLMMTLVIQCDRTEILDWIVGWLSGYVSLVVLVYLFLPRWQSFLQEADMGFRTVSEQPCWFLQTVHISGCQGSRTTLHVIKSCHIMFTLHDYDLTIIAGVTCEMGCQAFQHLEMSHQWIILMKFQIPSRGFGDKMQIMLTGRQDISSGVCVHQSRFFKPNPKVFFKTSPSHNLNTAFVTR